MKITQYLFNTRILASLLVIGLVGGLAGSTTLAYFSDTEASTGNTFAAGAIDLKIDWDETYNNVPIETQEMTDNPGAIFMLHDIKPGDEGEATISLHVYDNPSWVWFLVNQTSDLENGCNDPESEVDNTCGPEEGEGELGEYLMFHVWYDDGDNEFDNQTEETIFMGTAHDLDQGDAGMGMLLDADPDTQGIQVYGNETFYLGFAWWLPADVGNIVQTDSKTFDFEFYAEQRRHNDNPENPWFPDEEL